MGEIVRLPTRVPQTGPDDDFTSPDDHYVGTVHIYRTPDGEHYGVADDEVMDFQRRREFVHGLCEVASFAGFSLTHHAEEAGEDPVDEKNGLLAAIFLYHSGSMTVGLSKASQRIEGSWRKWLDARLKEARNMLICASKNED